MSGPHKGLVSDLTGEWTYAPESPPRDELVYEHLHQKEFSRQPQRRDFETHVDV